MRAVFFFCLLMSLTVLPGCMDTINIEDVSLGLLIGIDLNEDENLVVTSSSPVFYEEAKDKEENTIVISNTLRESREQFDATVTALSRRGKVQVILIGKRVLQHKDWFNILDTVYRDGKNTTMSRVVMVDGPVSDIAMFTPKDKPRLPMYLVKLVDTTSEQNLSVKTTIQELHRQFTEKGMTPSLTEMHKDDQVKVTGTALLDHSGKYKFTLDIKQSKLLKILQGETGGIFSFTLSLPEQPEKGLAQKNKLSFYPTTLQVKTKVDFADNQFVFHTAVKMGIVMTERLFKFDVEKNAPLLEKQIADEIQRQMQQLIKKIQKAKIDPMGYGLYARGHEYNHWKKVKDNWGEALAEADVNVKIKIKIQDMGSNR
ncbi:spore gernimation protein [Paenibacillus sp. FSL A5-0031]|uniref:Ger(x)C family spore germination protein n=1 Tax=Paenibacillus sp. FSL A5-0031 TaxID=1920420 RepID=UPI00096FC1A6|nr:Ger(x)C family spore germination protein [Paenibacillus sp. FSL A5-0031]OME82277.1 spore gernimation protein [Paenibacillus sp. FSL A5-0031]